MEFAESNFFNTTTMATVDSSTATVSNLIRWESDLQWSSDGFNDDLTTSSITIAFGETKAIDRIGLLNHNLKDYRIYYNGATANAFSLTSAATASSAWSSNSESSQYLFFDQVNASSVTFDFNSTQVANNEKAIGVMYIGAVRLDFERVPSANNYKPKISPKQSIHKMSDGTVREHTIAFKRSAEVKYKNITASFRDSLFTVWKSRDTLTFVAFGTSTGWDGYAFPFVWTGGFDFFRYSDNAAAAGFGGKIKISETNDN